MSQEILPFTGERFTPECVREIAYEHWHRYAFALSLVGGKRVLDAACGEGFGASLIAGRAMSVLAIDIDQASIEHAAHRYGAIENLNFGQGDVTRLDDLQDSSFDVILSFETLEHVREHDRMLADFHRLLKSDGLLLISTPDKKNYTDATGVVNPHHVRELYFDEFTALLDRHFQSKKIYTQKLLFQSNLQAIDQQGPVETLMHTQDGVVAGLSYKPMYYVAVCAKDSHSLQSLPGLSLYGDVEESVYAHYNQEVRYSIWAHKRIDELESQLADARQSELRVGELETQLADARQSELRVVELEAQLEDLRQFEQRIIELEAQLANVKHSDE